MKFLCSNGRHPLFAGALSFCAAALLAGCGRNDVQVYRVEKNQASTPSPDQPAALPPAHPDTMGAPPSLKWKSLPAGWQEAPPGQMRVAAFRIQNKEGKQADLGVVPMPGFMGHDLENVNRWRGAVGLAPVTEAELSKLSQAVEIGGEQGQLYDQAGENPGSGEKTRMLVAIARRQGIAWFFKMNGDDDLVAQQKPAFVDFLKSVTFESAPGQQALPPSHPPIGGPEMSAAQGLSAPTSSEGKPKWEVPAGWQEIPGGAFLVSKFSVNGSESPATTVNVSMSAGEGGGLLMNVNRWRGQVGLAPLSEADVAKELTSIDIPGGKATVVDMTGTDPKSGQKARVLAVVVPQSTQTWFYKMMGSDATVSREKDAFMKFVSGVKYQP